MTHEEIAYLYACMETEIIELKAEVERLKVELGTKQSSYECLKDEFNRAVEIVQAHCPKPALGHSWFEGICLLAQMTDALQAEVERLKAHTWEQERAAVVTWLRSDYRWAIGLGALIERGDHWPTEGGKP